MSDAEKTRAGFGIFHKILLSMLLVSLVPLGANWYIGRVKSIDDWTANGEATLVRAADSIAARVDGWIDTNLRAMRYTASLPDIQSMVAGRQDSVLAQLQGAYEWSYLAFTTDAFGKNIGRSDGKEQRDYSDRVYYRQVIQDGREVGQQTLIGRTSGKPALVLSVPIRGNAGNVGIVALASNLTEVTAAVAGSTVGNSGFAFLLDADGKAVAHPEEELSAQLRDMSNHPAFQAVKLSGRDSVIHRYDEAGRSVIAAARRIGLGWILVVQQDSAEVFEAVRESDRYTLYLGLAALLLVLVLALLVARRLTRPIVRLTAAADAMSRGNFEQRIAEGSRRDEIGALARAIDRMGMSIKVAAHQIRSQMRRS